MLHYTMVERLASLKHSNLLGPLQLQHTDTLHCDTYAQLTDIQHTGTQHTDIHHTGTQHTDIQHTDTHIQHNDTHHNVTLDDDA